MIEYLKCPNSAAVNDERMATVTVLVMGTGYWIDKCEIDAMNIFFLM